MCAIWFVKGERFDGFGGSVWFLVTGLLIVFDRSVPEKRVNTKWGCIFHATLP